MRRAAIGTPRGLRRPQQETEILLPPALSPQTVAPYKQLIASSRTGGVKRGLCCRNDATGAFIMATFRRRMSSPAYGAPNGVKGIDIAGGKRAHGQIALVGVVFLCCLCCGRCWLWSSLSFGPRLSASVAGCLLRGGTPAVFFAGFVPLVVGGGVVPLVGGGVVALRPWCLLSRCAGLLRRGWDGRLRSFWLSLAGGAVLLSVVAGAVVGC